MCWTDPGDASPLPDPNLQLKKEFPNWGAPKIRERLTTHFPAVRTPVKSTVPAVVDRNGLVKHQRRCRPKMQGTGLGDVNAPNDLWCTDYKGEFILARRRYCYPLTVTDFSSRFLLCCEALESTREAQAFTAFEPTVPSVRLARAHSCITRAQSGKPRRARTRASAPWRRRSRCPVPRWPTM